MYESPKSGRITNLAKLVIIAIAVAAFMGCQREDSPFKPVPDPSLSSIDAKLIARIPKFDNAPREHRYEIPDPTGENPGTIVVDINDNFLYFVMPNRKAIRYGISTGAEAYGWTGIARIARKSEWPRWSPPASMVKRSPHLQSISRAGGMKGGPDNPLGARALYLYQGNKDTLYRIHGTNEPDKIGLSVSSGCIRMRNIDVVDLYRRAKLDGKVIVK